MDNADKGWNLYRKLLHPKKNTTVIQKEEWKNDRWPRLRRNVGHYVIDPSVTSFRVMNMEERDDGRMLLHIKNQNGEIPTPCALKKTDTGKWRIWTCSL